MTYIVNAFSAVCVCYVCHEILYCSWVGAVQDNDVTTLRDQLSKYPVYGQDVLSKGLRLAADKGNPRGRS